MKSTGKNSYSVTGDLTIKGKTSPVTFSISIYGNKATASLKVDRTKYDIKYGSSSFFDDLKDKAIYDDFDLVTDLQFYLKLNINIKKNVSKLNLFFYLNICTFKRVSLLCTIINRYAI